MASLNRSRSRRWPLLVLIAVLMSAAAAIGRRSVGASPADSLDWPTDIAVDAQRGDLLLLMHTDTGRSCVDRYSADLDYQSSWGIGESAETIAVGLDGRVAAGVYDRLESHPVQLRPALSIHSPSGNLLTRSRLNSAALAHLDLASQGGDWLALMATTADAARPIQAQLLRLGADGGHLAQETVHDNATAIAVGPGRERYLVSSSAGASNLWRLDGGGAAQGLHGYSGVLTGLSVLPDGRLVFPHYFTDPAPPRGIACNLFWLDPSSKNDESIPLPGLRTRGIAAGPDGSTYVVARREGVPPDQNWELHRYNRNGKHLSMIDQPAMQHPCEVAPTATAGPSPTEDATVTPEAALTAAVTVTASAAESATPTIGSTTTATASATGSPRPVPTDEGRRIWLPLVTRPE